MLDHDFRRKGIGGSDVAAILKISPWQTPLGLYNYIKYGIKQKDNASMKAGREAEEGILRAYEALNNVVLERHKTIIDKECSIFRGNLDGFNEIPNIPVEVKRAFKRKGWGDSGSANIPNHYIVQCAWYAPILDSEKVDVAVKFEAEEEIKYYSIPRNKPLEERMRDKAYAWWQKHIVKNIAPDPINDYDQHNFVDMKIIDAPDHILDLHDEYKKLLPAVKEAQELKEVIKAWANENCKGKLQVLFPDKSLLGRQYFTERKTVDTKAMKKSGINVDDFVVKSRSLSWRLN